MSTDCIFCRIAAGEIPANVVLQTPSVLVFRDIAPKAPIHLLVIPKKHIATVNDITSEDWELVGQLFDAAAQAARMEGVAEKGYRLITNVNADGGQEVFHIHLHLLAGKRLGFS
jgi:histidine triad (HIT) family protein